MKPSKEQYKRICEKNSPPSKSYKTVPAAFLVGGLICAAGQGLNTFFTGLGMSQVGASTAVSCTLIFVGVALTALGLFEKIAKFAGAGTLVPITGFANSIASPAIEFKTEGFVLGTAVKMFSIAGPVLAFGISASVLYGIIFYILGGA